MHSLSEAGKDYDDELSLTTISALSGIIIGILVGIFATQFLAAFSQRMKYWLNDASILPEPLRILHSQIAEIFFQRAKREKQTEFEAVHHLARFELGMVFIVFFAFYIGLYVATNGTEVAPDHSFTTPFYIVLRLGMASCLLSAASYLFDYYRAPTFLLILALIAMIYTGLGLDHHFHLIRLSANNEPLNATLNEPLQIAAHEPPGGLEIIVVAPGGGIHASAWTGQVLSGLHEEYGEKFAEHLSLISAVSGGAVGTMFYLDYFDAIRRHASVSSEFKTANKDLIKSYDSVKRRASTSCLESLAWGATFPDSMRFVFGPFVREDRGSAQERRWLARMDIDLEIPLNERGAPTLRSWKRMADKGRMPYVIFNATEAETGRRVLFSSLDAENFSYESFDAPEIPFHFLREAGSFIDIEVATAVRLSSTFPYVTPAAMPPKNTISLGHIVDGGYVDNEGLLSVVEYLRKRTSKPTHATKFIVIRIKHTPPMESQIVDANDEGLDNAGFRYASLGPLVAINNVRAASQRERGQLELELLKENTKLQNKNQMIESVTIQFSLPEAGTSAPLNWKLSPRQRGAYEVAWRKLVKKSRESSSAISDEDAIRKLDKVFSNNR